MKKFICVLLCAVLAAGSVCCFSGCQKNNEKTTLNVYNWGVYIDMDVIKQFEDKTGIDVNYTTYASNEEMYSKIKSGAASYDVVIPSDYMISKMIEEDMLAPLDFSNIPNYSKIGADYKGLEYDPEEKYTVPYTWGTVVIIYNSKYVDEADVADQSVNLLWNEKYADKILMFDNPRDAFALALSKLGYSLNSENPDEWNAAGEELKKQKALLQANVMDLVFDKMINEEAYIAPYYAGDALTMLENNENLRAYVPVEGANMFVDAMCVLKTSQNKEAAEQFINFMCESDIAVLNANEIGYAIPQTEAYSMLTKEQQEDTLIYPRKEVLDNCEVFKNLPENILQLQSDLWVSLKTAENG